MRYAIIDVKCGENVGFLKEAHLMVDGGRKMVVNENELLDFGDVDEVAASMGGTLMGIGEVKEEIKRLNNG